MQYSSAQQAIFAQARHALCTPNQLMGTAAGSLNAASDPVGNVRCARVCACVTQPTGCVLQRPPPCQWSSYTQTALLRHRALAKSFTHARHTHTHTHRWNLHTNDEGEERGG